MRDLIRRSPIKTFIFSCVLTISVLATGCGDKAEKSTEPGGEPGDTSFTVTVEVCDGIGGGPGPGPQYFNRIDTLEYFYVLEHGYANLAVTVDGEPVAPSGSLIVDRDFTLRAMCDKKLIWELKLEKQVYYCCPAVGDDGTIYVSTGLVYWTDWGSLHAVSPGGVLLWSYDLDANGFSPVIGLDGAIYVQDADNTVYAVNPDGSLRWRYDDWDQKNHPRYDVGQRIPAIGEDGTVYVPADGLYALDPATGDRIWRFNPLDVKSCRQSPVIGSDGTIYVFIHQHDLYAVNPDGTEKWHAQLDDERHQTFACPAIDDDGTLYIPVEGRDELSFYASWLYAFNSDGSRKWKIVVSGQGRIVRASPTIAADGTIYIASRAAGQPLPSLVMAFTPEGTKMWEYVVEHTHDTLAGDDVYSTPSVGADGLMYFGSENEWFYALNPDGTVNWKCPLGYGINWTSAAILDDGTLYIGSMHSSPGYNGRLWALETTSMGYAVSPWPRFRHDHKNTGRFGAD